MQHLSIQETETFINTIQLSPQARLIHLMKLSLMEIKQYENAMRKKYNNALPVEIMAEINANILKHRETFGKKGTIRKLIFQYN